MKKKIILSLLVIVALFTITGCGKSNENEAKTNEKEGEQNQIKNHQMDFNLILFKEKIMISKNTQQLKTKH